MVMIKIDKALADSLKGKEFVKDNKFNPVEDDKGQWYISEEEYKKADIKESTDLLKDIDESKDKITKEEYELVKVDKVKVEEEKLAKEVK